MIDSKNWDRLEQFIDNGAVALAVPHIVKEIQEQLTSEQLEPLGDLTESLLNIFSKKSNARPRVFVAGFIEMAKKGAIKNKS